MKKFILASSIMITGFILSFATYVFAHRDFEFDKYNMSNNNELNFKQMYDTCTSYADGDTRDLMDTYGRERMQTMHNSMMGY